MMQRHFAPMFAPAPIFLPAPEPIEWRTVAGWTDNYVFLYRGIQPIGRWDHDARTYEPIVANSYRAFASPPVTPPSPPTSYLRRIERAEAEKAKAINVVTKKDAPVLPDRPPIIEESREQIEVQNFGVEADKLGMGPRYSANDKGITKEEAYKAVQNGKLTDDSGKLNFTVIGDESDRKKVLADMPVPLKERCKVWDVPTGHHSLKDTATGKVMFPEGKPCVMLQAPDGEVLYREADYRTGDFEAIRKAVDDYDSRKDPGRNKTPTPASPGINLADVPAWVWTLLACGVVLLLTKGQKQ